MNYQQIGIVVKEQLQGKRMKLYGILLTMLIGIACVNQVGSLELIATNNVLYFGYLLLTLCIAIVQNTVYFLFIKRVRDEKFTSSDITYSFSKALYHIACSLLMSLIQVAIQSILLSILYYVPMLADPVLLFSQVILSSVSLFIAFAIYDRTKGIMQILSGSFIILKRNWKAIIMSMLPYLIYSLLCTLALNYVINTMVTGEIQSFTQAVESSFANPDTTIVAYSMIGIYVANIIGGGYFLVSLYMAYANIYNEEYKSLFTKLSVKKKR